MSKPQKQYVIVEAPSNLGLIEPVPGVEPGVKWLSKVLLELGFGATLNISGTHCIQPPPYTMNIDPASGIRNADAIAHYSEILSVSILNCIQGNYFPIVLGGDCSILIGNALALKKNGRYGLFFIDGHTDYVTPQQSGTAGAAGMDLALVTGNGPGKLTNIAGLKPYLKESHVFCFGNREYTGWYEEAIERSEIWYYNLKKLRQQGIAQIIQEFLAMVDSEKLDGFWIHFDVDVLDDAIMPCVDSRNPDGLSYEELTSTLVPLLSSGHAMGIDITILDPTRDPDREYCRQFVKEMNGIFLEAQK